MLQYEWIPEHAVASNDANTDVPEDDKNLLVLYPVEQQHIFQDPNPFSLLSNDEDSENDDNEAKQVLPDKINNQGAEDVINAKQNDFEPKQEDQGTPQKVQGKQKDHESRGAQIKVEDILQVEKSDNESYRYKEEPDL